MPKLENFTVKEIIKDDQNPLSWSLDNKNVLDTLNKQDAFGVFQFETKTAMQIIQEINVDSFSDIYIATALGRPDPLSAELHKMFGKRKRGEQKFPDIDCLGSLYKECKGLPIFQESVMQFSRKIAGFSASESNKLRKGLAKGKDNEEAYKTLKKLLEELKERAKESIKNKLITEKQLKDNLDMFEGLGGYGFNLSHAVSYALIAFWCMHLKYFYPAHFLCSLFNFTETSEEDKEGNLFISKYVRYAKKRKVKVLPPDVNLSDEDFCLTKGNEIRWGLARIKNVKNSGSVIVEERNKNGEFKGFEDFFTRIPKRQCNKTKIKSLILSGAFDSFGEREEIYNEFLKKTSAKGSYEFEELSPNTQKTDEEELLGICISQDIMPEIPKNKLKEWNCSLVSENKIKEGSSGRLIGKIKTIKKTKNKKNKDLLHVTIEDNADELWFYVSENHIKKTEEIFALNRIIVIDLKRFNDSNRYIYSGNYLKPIKEKK